MTKIHKVQWRISIAVLVYGSALLPVAGSIAVFFIGIGLLYCAVAAIAARGALLPLVVAWVANGLLAVVCWRMIAHLFTLEPRNNPYGQPMQWYDHLSIDSIAAVAILVLISVYAVTLARDWKHVHTSTRNRVWW
jgi:NADH:ubiquinone oxidoreductase subunit 5 (subunit L)/multisubunit Na+/H+ antiporter MnhA subunit